MAVSFRRLLLFFHLQSQRGMSLVEMLVVLGIVAVLIAVIIPRLNKSNLNLPVVEQTLVADIRMARANAASRGAHYKVSVSASTYSVQRLQDDDEDGVWEPDGGFPTYTVNLPEGIAISEGAGSEIEFTTRGLLTSNPDGTPAAVISVTILDSIHSRTKTVEIWPSGQVEEV
jgi:prepilin-type N-terminal cleavage/methylation domain-containing protein